MPMTSLLAVLKARRRLIAPLIPLAGAALDHLAFSGELVRTFLLLAGVYALMNVPGRYFQYQRRARK